MYSRAEAIGWLFDDVKTAPRGENITLEMASELTAWEQVHGNFMSSAPIQTEGSSAGRLYGLELHPNEMNDGYFAAQGETIVSNDATGRVLETLGHYPDAAYQFLTDPGAGDARITQIFKDRDWSGPDGFQGPASLMLGFEQAKGGPLNPDFDTHSSTIIAGIDSKILNDLADNKSFVNTNISEQGSGVLAAALAPNLDLLADHFIKSGFIAGDSQGVFQGHAIGMGSQTLPGPDVSLADFQKILGEIGAHYKGASVLQGSINDYQTLYAKAAAFDPNDASDALKRSIFLQGSLDGSSSAATIAAARVHDKEVDDDIDGLMSIVGLIPVPEIGELAEGGTKVILNLGQDIALDTGKDVGTHFWKESLYQTQQAIADSQKAADVNAVSANLSAAHFLTDILGANKVGPIPTMTAGEDPTKYEHVLRDWWSTTSERLQNDPEVQKALPGVSIDELGSSYQLGVEAAAEGVSGP
jgi:hypothetical protein